MIAGPARSIAPWRRPPWGRSPSTTWFLAVGLLAVATALSLATRSVTAALLRGALGRSLGTSDVRVDLVAWPPPAVWWGHVDVLSVAARTLRIGTLDVDAFDATLNQVELDPAALYRRGAVVVRSLGAGTARVTVSADALARVLASQASVRDAVVEVRAGHVILSATVSVLGAPLRAQGDGHLVLRNGTEVDLLLDRVTVGGVALPPPVVGRAMRAVNPIVTLNGLPFGLRLTGVTAEDGRVMLDAATGAAPDRR